MNRICVVLGKKQREYTVREGEIIVFARLEGYGVINGDTVEETIIGICLKTQNEIKEVLSNRGYCTSTKEKTIEAIKEIVGSKAAGNIEKRYFTEGNKCKNNGEDWKIIKNLLFNCKTK